MNNTCVSSCCVNWIKLIPWFSIINISKKGLLCKKKTLNYCNNSSTTINIYLLYIIIDFYHSNVRDVSSGCKSVQFYDGNMTRETVKDMDNKHAFSTFLCMGIHIIFIVLQKYRWLKGWNLKKKCEMTMNCTTHTLS